VTTEEKRAMEDQLWQPSSGGTDRNSEDGNSNTVVAAPHGSSGSEAETYEALERMNTMRTRQSVGKGGTTRKVSSHN